MLLQPPLVLGSPLRPELARPLLRREPQRNLAGVDVQEDLVFREQTEDEIRVTFLKNSSKMLQHFISVSGFRPENGLVEGGGEEEAGGEQLLGEALVEAGEGTVALSQQLPSFRYLDL